MLDHLWAGWRSAYLEAVTGDPTALRPNDQGSLFERLLALAATQGDEAAMVVDRGERVSALLNAYPYATGHLLVVPNRAAANLEDLDEVTHADLWSLVRRSVAAVREAYGCGGVNVGLNLGAAAGAGVPDHLHVHVVPRWEGDTNFMTAAAGTRVLPEPLDQTWARLRSVWPPS